MNIATKYKHKRLAKCPSYFLLVPKAPINPKNLQSLQTFAKIVLSLEIRNKYIILQKRYKSTLWFCYVFSNI